MPDGSIHPQLDHFSNEERVSYRFQSPSKHGWSPDRVLVRSLLLLVICLLKSMGSITKHFSRRLPKTRVFAKMSVWERIELLYAVPNHNDEVILLP